MKLSLTNPAMWGIHELAPLVARALATDYAGPSNARIRELPDLRSIRYYTTLGLIDRPCGFRKRTALYGPRHLMQLVAIKRLQAQGRSLAEIQLQLCGLPDAALKEIARLPPGIVKVPEGAQAAEETERRDARPFWSQPPGEVASPVPFPAPRQMIGMPLGAGVTLLVEATRPLEAADWEALRAAAAPLLETLQARRLLGTDLGPSFTHEETP
jgi:DNA-binding transcriptional MerR regulator